MNSELTDLAREAVACVPIEEWPAGARFFEYIDDKSGHGPCRIVDTREWTALQKGYWYIDDSDGHQCSRMNLAQKQDRLIPDLTDPATLGCLLHLVREACTPAKFREAVGRCFGIHARGKRSMMDERGIVAKYLVAALEAANG